MHCNLTKVLIYTLKMVLSAYLSIPALRRFVGYCARPPQGCETILSEILQPKRYCLLVKSPSLLAHNIMVGKRDDKICNNALYHTQLAQPRSNNARITIGISRYVVCFLTDKKTACQMRSYSRQI